MYTLHILAVGYRFTDILSPFYLVEHLPEVDMRNSTNIRTEIPFGSSITKLDKLNQNAAKQSAAYFCMK
jgi:hypothetical protein